MVSSSVVSKEHAAAWGFSKLASIDNPKAAKATAYGYLNAILYMAPADTAGVGNFCVHAGACKDLCLGLYSGQAAIGAPEKNVAVRARMARAVAYQEHRREFVSEVERDVRRLSAVARRLRLKLCYRANGSTDTGLGVELARSFPKVTFIDYTKNPNRVFAYLAGKLPANYFVTFSRDTHNEHICDRVLAAGGNVAVVFGSGAPETWHGYRVVDGDKHDVRIPELDGRGVVIGLTPKGRKAKRDTSGFVVH